MAKFATDNPGSFISQVSLIGRSGGAVKTLAGFKKAHHTVPDAVNAATSRFLGQLCTSELTAEGEGFFQRTKTAMAYKRAAISLDVTGTTAVLVAKDFTLEVTYALEEADPARYAVTRTLHSLRNGDVVQTPEFDALFAGQFSAISFALKKAVRVEAVIDAVEGLDEDATLRVTYPSDYRHCVLSVAGIGAEVTCDGATLAMDFGRNGSPKELVEAFAAVRAEFKLAKDRVLSGLL